MNYKVFQFQSVSASLQNLNLLLKIHQRHYNMRLSVIIEIGLCVHQCVRKIGLESFLLLKSA